MQAVTFIDLFANVGGLRNKFERAFQSAEINLHCLMTAELIDETIYLSKNGSDSDMRTLLSHLDYQEIPNFDFLLASYPYQALGEKPNQLLGDFLFSEIERILREKKPYGFIIENMEGFIRKEDDSIEVSSKAFNHIVTKLKKLGYQLSWQVTGVGNLEIEKNRKSEAKEASELMLSDTVEAGKNDPKKVFIIGTLGSQMVLTDIKKGMFSYLDEKNHSSSSSEHELIDWLFKHDDIPEHELADWYAESEEFTDLQKDLLTLLLSENQKKQQDIEQPLSSFDKTDSKLEATEKEVYFKLYPPKKMVEITKEDGSVTSLIHSFIFQEVFEETVKALDVTRDINTDLTALFSSADEQILVIDGAGKIIRVSGYFLNEFWNLQGPEELLGRNIAEFTKQNIFQPNIFELCQTKMEKVTAIQESNDRRIWSVATPVYEDDVLERVVVLSKDITKENTLEEVASSDLLAIPDPIKAAQSDEKQLIYRSKKIENLLSQILRVAPMNSTVLLQGESGVGKEVFANQIHLHSNRKDKPYIKINSGAIPEQLIESELFGYEPFAFTGADAKGKRGYFEQADGGTIFLDEIGELPLNMQVKLLRVIQEREVVRVGGIHPIPVDVRIIAATNQNLKQLVDNGEFREDLYYRLNVIPFKIPKLQDRKEDIFPLAIYFLELFKRMYKIEKNFTPEAINVIEASDWPGNVRELQNIIERLIVISPDEWIKREDVLLALHGEIAASEKELIVMKLMPLQEAVDEVERQLIKLGLQKYKTAAEVAEVLEISASSLSRRMKKLKLS